MTCTQTDRCLDAMMDGALSEADRAALERHCSGCAACAARLKANRELMAVFSEMAPEIDVPLATQAAWRGAVKAEARKNARPRRLYRWAAGIAAALVAALGFGLAFRTTPTDVAPQARSLMTSDAAPKSAAMTNDAPMMALEAEEACADEESFMVEADGAAEESVGVAASRPLPMHEIRMTVEALDKTCLYMADLVSEYDGSLDVQRFEADGAACANLYIDLPAANAEEFVRAAAHYDVTGASHDELSGDAGDAGDAGNAGDASEGRVSLLLVLRSE